MYDLNDILANLTPGQLPLSIGTSFAIESSLGIMDKDNFDSDKNPNVTTILKKQQHIQSREKAPVENVKEVWINIRTLFRNIYNALDNSVKDNLSPQLAVDVVLNEMNLIPNIYNQYMGNKVRVVFYVCGHRTMDKVFPYALHRSVKTEKQKHYYELEQHVAFFCINKLNNIKKFEVKFSGIHPSVMLMTHVAVDLLWRRAFESVVLLESHTGKIKKHPEWNSKLTNGKAMPFMPFNFFTIQVFGDNGNFFTPFVHGIKNEIVELAKKRNWTPVTTKDKIIMDIKTISDPSVKKYLLDCCSGW